MGIVEQIDFENAKCISGRALAVDLLLDEVVENDIAGWVPVEGGHKYDRLWGHLNGVPVYCIKDYRVTEGDQLCWIAFGSLLVAYQDTSIVIETDKHFREM